MLPATSLPVKITPVMIGFIMTDSTSLLGISRLVNTPSGSPASLYSCSMATADPKTLEACFKTATFPAIIAGAEKRKTCQNGKFQGIIPKTAPCGSRSEEHTSELQSRGHLVCRLLLEKKKATDNKIAH